MNLLKLASVNKKQQGHRLLHKAHEIDDHKTLVTVLGYLGGTAIGAGLGALEGSAAGVGMGSVAGGLIGALAGGIAAHNKAQKAFDELGLGKAYTAGGLDGVIGAIDTHHNLNVAQQYRQQRMLSGAVNGALTSRELSRNRDGRADNTYTVLGGAAGSLGALNSFNRDYSVGAAIGIDRPKRKRLAKKR